MNTPEQAASEYWNRLCSLSPSLGAAIIGDFVKLDRPALRVQLDDHPSLPSVKYGLIAEGTETVSNQLIDDAPASRYLTVVFNPESARWEVVSYGISPIDPLNFERPDSQ